MIIQIDTDSPPDWSSDLKPETILHAVRHILRTPEGESVIQHAVRLRRQCDDMAHRLQELRK